MRRPKRMLLYRECPLRSSMPSMHDNNMQSPATVIMHHGYPGWLLAIISVHAWYHRPPPPHHQQQQRHSCPARTETEHKSSHSSLFILIWIDFLSHINQQQQKQSTKALTHYLSSFDSLSHQLSSRSSLPSPYAVGIEGPIVDHQQVEEERPWHFCVIQFSLDLGVSIFTNIYCCLLNPHYHYILYLFFNATQWRWQAKWRGFSLVPPVDNAGWNQEGRRIESPQHP